MKDVGGVAETRSLGRMDGRTDGWRDRQNNTHTVGRGSFL